MLLFTLKMIRCRNDWIQSGEKRNSYIPSRPDEYYTRTGRWISWVSLNESNNNSNNCIRGSLFRFDSFLTFFST
jgi:hypothetical protein